MKYVIYGANRITKDFIYIFKNLNILYIVDDNKKLEKICNFPVNKIENLLTDKSYDKIILCDFNKEVKEKNLQDFGFIYGKDYLYEEDFFYQLDDIFIPNNRKIAVWGTGNRCKFLLKYNLPWNIDIFIDSYKKQENIYNIPIYTPDEITNWEDYYIIIAVEKDKDIQNYLLNHGLIENEDFISYMKILNLPSILLRQTIFDQSYYDLKCNTMQSHLEILPDGCTRSCCTTFVSQGLDNIFDKNRDELWHSILHKILYLSTENRTFSFCDKTMCPLFIAKKKELSVLGKDIYRPYKEISDFPETLALSYDSSCNLSCITCRKEQHFAKGKELETINKITDMIICDYLPNCKFLILAGNGEVFASPAYQKIYKSNQCNPQYIRLLSNGTLFTPKNWEEFTKGKTAKIMLTVSIDAAMEETYKYIRRGNFNELKRNMEFASKLRQSGALRYFRINFVVQKENYKEMIPFVKWGQALHVDEVFFTKILNWGTYTSEEFAQVSMMEEDGITPKEELKEIIKNSVMNSDIVDMGTIQFAHKIDDIDVVENYYMWELEKRGGKIFS